MMKCVVVEHSLVNEYGNWYGTLYQLFAEKPADAREWISENLNSPDGRPYYVGNRMDDQVRVEVVTAYNENGDLDRSPFWGLLRQFADHNIGPSTLKKIAALMPQ